MSQKSVEAALSRRYGMAPEAKARVDEINKKAIWVAHCRKCHAKLEGTLEEIRGHVCGT